ncbi:MAG: hypothetical protein RRA92_07265 [Gemmatimonadota bacterium]|nr:hypothetical protein [Gemmatimonadota bacterium]
MLQLLGLPLIVAAWALPALFVLFLAGLFAWAGLRPVYRVWARGVDALVGATARMGLRVAERMAAAALGRATRHPVRGD